MKYIGKFKNINEKLYTIEIISNNDASSVKELTLTDEPITTSIKGNDENIYEPLRCSESTISIVTDTPLLDIYSESAKGTTVKLFDEQGNIKWTGFIEPLLYNQDWESDKDILEINCLDGLAILQYIDYKAENKSLKSFVSIINDMFQYIECYKSFYLPTTLSYNLDDTIIKSFTVSENNFFDEDGEAMKMQEVLEEICKWLNITCEAHGDEVYFLDLDGIKNKNTTYLKYTVGNASSYTRVTLSDTYSINAESYTEDGAEISLSNVYNKVTVKDDFYPTDNFLPNIWDDLSNINNKYKPVEQWKTPPYMPLGAFKHMNYFQFFESPNYEYYGYQMSGSNQKNLSVNWSARISPKEFQYDNLMHSVGAVICKHKAYLTEFGKNYEEPAKLNLDKYLLIYLHDQFPIASNIPIFRLKAKAANNNLVVGSNAFLLFTCEAIFMDDVDEVGGDISSIVMAEEHERDSRYVPDNGFLNVQVKIGNKYWNGNNWTTSPSTFHLEFDAWKNGKVNFVGKTFPLISNVKWTDYLNEDGYKIKLENNMITTNPEITIYYPTKRIQPKYRSEAMWIKNFEVKLVVSNAENTDLIEEGDKTDTEYTNVANGDSVKEMDEISFKICTNDNKSANYSSVSYSNGQMVDNVVINGISRRMEEHLIYKIVNQYKDPSVILDLSLHNEFLPYTILSTHFFNGKEFVIDSQQIDWAMNQSTLHIIEKK